MVLNHRIGSQQPQYLCTSSWRAPCSWVFEKPTHPRPSLLVLSNGKVMERLFLCGLLSCCPPSIKPNRNKKGRRIRSSCHSSWSIRLHSKTKWINEYSYVGLRVDLSRPGQWFPIIGTSTPGQCFSTFGTCAGGSWSFHWFPPAMVLLQ